MSDDLVCPFCESAETVEVSFSEELRVGRNRLSVAGLTKLVCSHCGSESIPGVMHDANLALIRAATEEKQGAVTAGMLRTLRDTWSFNQKEASAIFGAGMSSFAKWESGQAKLSGPSALLVQVALKFPQVVPHLAALAGVKMTCDSAGYHSCIFEPAISFEAWVPQASHTQRERQHQHHRKALPDWGTTYTVDDSLMLVAA